MEQMSRWCFEVRFNEIDSGYIYTCVVMGMGMIRDFVVSRCAAMMLLLVRVKVWGDKIAGACFVTAGTEAILICRDADFLFSVTQWVVQTLGLLMHFAKVILRSGRVLHFEISLSDVLLGKTSFLNFV